MLAAKVYGVSASQIFRLERWDGDDLSLQVGECASQPGKVGVVGRDG